MNCPKPACLAWYAHLPSCRSGSSLWLTLVCLANIPEVPLFLCCFCLISPFAAVSQHSRKREEIEQRKHSELVESFGVTSRERLFFVHRLAPANPDLSYPSRADPLSRSSVSYTNWGPSRAARWNSTFRRSRASAVRYSARLVGVVCLERLVGIVAIGRCLGTFADAKQDWAGPSGTKSLRPKS